ncbi:MAG: ATP-dependent helicase HrpB, partial [Geminicoccaceae bacterium]
MPAPTGFPVETALPELLSKLTDGNAAVLEAPPGAGKTSLIPLHLLDAPWLEGRRILVLEPRRLAARAAAARMAELLGEPLGETVGYAMRFERRIGARTRIEVVTEGLLTRHLQADPALDRYGAVVFDEFHERALDADLGLALCLEVQGSIRPDLRILPMSATLDGAAIASHLGHAPLIRSEGRQYPVRVEHLGGSSRDALEFQVAQAVELALAAVGGGVLVFLPGAREIGAAGELLRGRLSGVPVLPLYGDLPRAAQDAAIRPSAARRVVLATNVAETSLTIEGISAVVDSGLERRQRFSARTGMSRLVTVPIARASAEQRAGRAGRLGPGLCLRLWSVEEDRARAPHRPAEIEEADLAPLALELAAWGVADPGRLRFPTPPPVGPFTAARRLLTELGAVSVTGVITPHGRAMSELPLHPRLAHMVLTAGEHRPTAVAAAALLGTRAAADAGTDFARRLGEPIVG